MKKALRTLRNYLKKHNGTVAAYCKVVSIYDQPINDKYAVLFQDCGAAAISELFTEKELTKAKRYWKFVREWKEVKSIKNMLLFPLGVFYTDGIMWKEWDEQNLLSCKGPDD